MALAERRYADAERDCRAILAAAPDDPRAYESLAIALQGQGRLPEAEAALRAGRDRIGWRDCSFSSNLAVLLFLQRRPAEAQAELERARPRIGVEPTLPCRATLVHLGELYRAAGRNDEARRAYEEFLELTRTSGERATQRYRQQAERGLAALGAGSPM